MPRKQKKYHYIYRTTNIINGKYYIGIHTTDNLNDGYIGSGKKLWYSINKYGKENFKCEILEILPDRSSLIEREKEMVNEELLDDPMCMNLTVGGGDGFYHINKNGMNNKSNQFILGGKASAEKLKNDVEYRNRHREWVRKNAKRLYEEGKFKPINWTGKKHTLETIEKMKQSKFGHGLGSTNSQFGTCWITNGIENKKIKRNDSLPDGWELGRTLK